jgi:NTE family protein
MGQARGPSIGLALGGGAAKGFAHVPVMEAFDELGVEPTLIAGTSIGSIFGACRAGGMAGGEIRSYVVDLFASRRRLFGRLFSDAVTSWSTFLTISSAAVISPEKLFEATLPDGLPATFEDLAIPLRIVATDFDSQAEVILDGGPLIPAIAASSCLPGLLHPVRHQGRLLIDGGFVNPTPIDALRGAVDLVVAVDVTGRSAQPAGRAPTAMDLVVGSTQIALAEIARLRRMGAPADLLLHPDLSAFESLDFFKADEILAACEPLKEQTKRGLDALLARRSPTT